MITERQAEILNKIIEEYINSVTPISSQLLEKKYRLGISPATIRIEMQKLTEEGYLWQPHISAGRIPTDKGYRFLVDRLLEEELTFDEIKDWFKEDFGEEIQFLQSLTKKMAKLSGTLVLSYLKKENILLKEGWEEIFKEPEFKRENCLMNFVEFLADLEKGMKNFKINSEIKIYIGAENPFKKARDFSIISSKYRLSKRKEGIISLVGPKRMDYEKNIRLINSFVKSSEKW